MRYEFDMIVIGLGPAGMAVSIMGSSMGLKVCSIEKHKIGGECMNVGCIPSKALLRIAKIRHAGEVHETYSLRETPLADPDRPFEMIQQRLKFINEKKTRKMFDKVELILGQGAAEFVDPHTVRVGERTVTASNIFVCAGTKPHMPDIEGLAELEDPLTNNNVFTLETIPESLVILGGGAIGCEMAQAFKRLGSTVTVVHNADHLIPIAPPEAGALVGEVFAKEGITVLNGRNAVKVETTASGMALHTDKGEVLEAERLLVAAGRAPNLEGLNLEAAGILRNDRGWIVVDDTLRTAQKHIYAPGDCNGHVLLSHAAMHQGMLALMNSMTPWPFKQRFKSYPVPWTIFTDPPVSHVGKTEKQLQREGVRYDVIESKYEDYGAAIAEGVPEGFVRVLASTWGRIYGATIVGEGSGEMINEWALAIQKGARLHDIMMQMHSFPTMGFLTKRIGETWMMKKMQSASLRGWITWWYRLRNGGVTG